MKFFSQYMRSIWFRETFEEYKIGFKNFYPEFQRLVAYFTIKIDISFPRLDVVGKSTRAKSPLHVSIGIGIIVLLLV